MSEGLAGCVPSARPEPIAQLALWTARIARLEAFPIGVRLAKPIFIGGRRYEKAKSLLVHIITEYGEEGWGEAAPDGAKGDRLETLVAQCRDVIAPALRAASPEERTGLLADLGNTGRCSWRSIAAVEIALGDALAKRAGLRFCDLWSGAIRRSVPQIWLLGGPTVEQDLAEAEALHAEGIKFFALKVASKSLDEDVRLARCMRTALGDTVHISADANEAWNVETARSFLTQTRDVVLSRLEQPLPVSDLAGAAELAADPAAPICIDQGVFDAEDIMRWYQARAIGGAVIKVSKFGGMRRAVAAGVLCDALGLKVGLATPIAETSVGTAAALHLAAALPQVDWAVGPSGDYLAEDIVDAPIRHRKGLLTVPAAPGLGVTVDQHVVERLRLDR